MSIYAASCLETGCNLSSWTLGRCYGHYLVAKGRVDEPLDELFAPSRTRARLCPLNGCGVTYHGWEEQKACSRTHRRKWNQVLRAQELPADQPVPKPEDAVAADCWWCGIRFQALHPTQRYCTPSHGAQAKAYLSRYRKKQRAAAGPTCPTPDAKAYPTMQEAQRALTLKKFNDPAAGAMLVQWCSCGAFHLGHRQDSNRRILAERLDAPAILAVLLHR